MVDDDTVVIEKILEDFIIDIEERALDQGQRWAKSQPIEIRSPIFNRIHNRI